MIYNKAVCCHSDHFQQGCCEAIPVETHLNGMSSICTLLSADTHSVLSAKATRRGRLIHKVGLLFFADDVVKYIPPRKGRANVLRLIRELLATEPIKAQTDISRALDLTALSAGCPDLRCFNRCTVAARTLVRLLGAATRLEMLQLLCRIAYSSGHAIPLGQQE